MPRPPSRSRRCGRHRRCASRCGSPTTARFGVAAVRRGHPGKRQRNSGGPHDPARGCRTAAATSFCSGQARPRKAGAPIAAVTQPLAPDTPFESLTPFGTPWLMLRSCGAGSSASTILPRRATASSRFSRSPSTTSSAALATNFGLPSFWSTRAMSDSALAISLPRRMALGGEVDDALEGQRRATSASANEETAPSPPARHRRS